MVSHPSNLALNWTLRRITRGESLLITLNRISTIYDDNEMNPSTDESAGLQSVRRELSGPPMRGSIPHSLAIRRLHPPGLRLTPPIYFGGGLFIFSGPRHSHHQPSRAVAKSRYRLQLQESSARLFRWILSRLRYQ